MKRENNIWHFLWQFKFSSLLLRNLGIILLLMVIPIAAIIYISYEELEREQISRIKMINEELLNKNVVVTENIIGNISALLNDLATDEIILNALMETDLNWGATSRADWTFQTIQEKIKGNPYIVSVYLYSNISGSILDVQQSQVQDARLYLNKGKWYYLHLKYDLKVPYTLIDEKNDLLFCHPALDAQGNSCGVIVFEVSVSKIHEILEQEGTVPNGSLLMIDIAGNVLYSSQSGFSTLDAKEKTLLLKQISQVRSGETNLIQNGVAKYISVMESENQSWKYALVMKLPEYEDELNRTRSYILSSLGIGLMLILLTAFVITIVTYRPIKQIIGVMEKPQSYSDRAQDNSPGEIAYITANILNSLSSNKAMSTELEERIRKAREYQAYALQFQINPHFLYNTLETIRWSVIEETHSMNRSSELISKVANLYRIGLETSNVLLTLKEELDFLQLYVDILIARYRQKITFIWEIDETLYRCKVIKLCVQPLIENAISHGLKPRGYRGTIKIKAYREQDKLCIAVENDGEGLTEGQVLSLNKMLQSREAFGDRQVGLRNVNERIKLIFGEEYGATLSRIDKANGNSGTRTLITFPFNEAHIERS